MDNASPKLLKQHLTGRSLLPQVIQCSEASHCCVQIGIIPFAGVDIATFELMKQRLLEEYHGDPPPVSILAAGMLSSSVAQFASYPLSLVRTRLQVGDAAVPD